MTTMLYNLRQYSAAWPQTLPTPPTVNDPGRCRAKEQRGYCKGQPITIGKQQPYTWEQETTFMFRSIHDKLLLGSQRGTLNSPVTQDALEWPCLLLAVIVHRPSNPIHPQTDGRRLWEPARLHQLAHLAQRCHGKRRHRFCHSRDGHRDNPSSCLLRHRERAAFELP